MLRLRNSVARLKQNQKVEISLGQKALVDSENDPLISDTVDSNWDDSPPESPVKTSPVYTPSVYSQHVRIPAASKQTYRHLSPEHTPVQPPVKKQTYEQMVTVQSRKRGKIGSKKHKEEDSDTMLLL